MNVLLLKILYVFIIIIIIETGTTLQMCLLLTYQTLKCASLYTVTSTLNVSQDYIMYPAGILRHAFTSISWLIPNIKFFHQPLL